MHAPQTHTVGVLLTGAEEVLRAAGIKEPRLNAELLLSGILGVRRGDLLALGRRTLPGEREEDFRRALERRCQREPLQYILGETEFLGLPFTLDRGVLIPRPDTEVLVEEAARLASGNPAPRILEPGTGSGAVAVGLAHLHPGARILAVDSSPGALRIARLNADRNGVADRITFRQADILTESIGGDGTFHVLVSNPPYISLREFSLLPDEVRAYEPRQALTDGGDGLNFHRRLALVGMEVLADGGAICLEIAYDQKEGALDILAESGFRELTAVKDYAGNWRVVTGRKA